jgi:hypothetical protein
VSTREYSSSRGTRVLSGASERVCAPVERARMADVDDLAELRDLLRLGRARGAQLGDVRRRVAERDDRVEHALLRHPRRGEERPRACARHNSDERPRPNSAAGRSACGGSGEAVAPSLALALLRRTAPPPPEDDQMRTPPMRSARLAHACARAEAHRWGSSAAVSTLAGGRLRKSTEPLQTLCADNAGRAAAQLAPIHAAQRRLRARCSTRLPRVLSGGSQRWSRARTRTASSSARLKSLAGIFGSARLATSSAPHRVLYGVL